MADSELLFLGAADLARSLAGGTVSSVELTEAVIAQIERHDGAINAVCVRDFDRALASAKDADAARARGDERPLLGLPMTVKESYNVAGLPTTWGFTHFRDFVPEQDALAVARVKAAGAVLVGKTNVPVGLGDFQSYNDIYGTTGNPWDTERTCGGSSGGSAAALAAGYGPLSLGSDIGGSLRNPAHFCGVYAHKPTLGLLPARGHIPPPAPALPGESDLAVIGPMTRSASDLSLLLDLLAEPDELALGAAYRLALPPAPRTRLSDYRVLVLTDHPLLPSSASVRSAVTGLAEKLAAAGASVRWESALLPDLTEASLLYSRMLMSVLAARLPEEAQEQARAAEAELSDDDTSASAARIRGMVLSHRDWLIADGQRQLLRHHWRALFTEVDLVLAPVMPTPAFHHDHSPTSERTITIDGVDHAYFDQLNLAGIATLPGLPATAFPAGLSTEGLPIGLQAIGPAYGDRATIRFAELVEREFGGFVPPPLS
jgi:amidase